MFVDGFATFLWFLVFLSVIDLIVSAFMSLCKIYTKRKLREKGKVQNETFSRYSLIESLNGKKKEMITSEKKTLMLCNLKRNSSSKRNNNKKES
jgi:hypothetical protein